MSYDNLGLSHNGLGIDFNWTLLLWGLSCPVLLLLSDGRRFMDLIGDGSDRSYIISSPVTVKYSC